MKRHALRFTERRMASIDCIHRAGPRGLPLIDADEPALLEEWGLVERFTDERRIFSHRVRLTPHGERCACTLIDKDNAMSDLENTTTDGSDTAAEQQTWTTTELQADFDVLAFAAPFVEVIRKSDGVKGSLQFDHAPRIYYGFKADS